MNLFNKNLKEKRIFLDYASSTPVLPEVKKVMEKYLEKDFYNPSAIYEEGVKLRTELNNFRKEIARILHVTAKDIIFTSGGTESNNLAVLGIFEAFRGKIEKPHFIVSSIEHSAILETVKEIERRGGEVSIISVNEEGFVSAEEVIKNLKETTVLVSIILSNNEIGTIEPISRIGRKIKEYRKKQNSSYPYFHTDASQAANYLSLDVTSLSVDLMTIDGSKIYGPKSSGLLVVRPNVLIRPIIFGGGQENGLRSGTENLFLISGLAKAISIANNDREKERERLNSLKLFFIDEIVKKFPNLIINTPKENSLPNIVSISFPGQIGEFIAIKLDQQGIMVSTGSSCGIFKDIGASETIKAIGKKDLAESTIRFSFGRETTKKNLEKVIKSLEKVLF